MNKELMDEEMIDEETMDEETIPNAAARVVMKGAKEVKKKHGTVGVILYWMFIFTCVVFSYLLFRGIVSVGVNSAVESYKTAFDEAKDESYDTAYERAKTAAIEKYKAISKVTIQLGDIKEVSNLEVLSVIKDDYVVENEEDKKNGLYLWTKYRGQGVFTVNLQTAEFIVDDNNHYVLVRVPLPEMTQFEIIDKDTERLLFVKNGVFSIDLPWTTLTFGDGSYKEGVNLAMEQKAEAYNVIKDSILSDEQYVLSAKKMAELEIKSLIKSINSNAELKDLEVDVEFY